MVEIEGDAVFFLKESNVPPKKVVGRAKEIFIQFHKHLLSYEHNRICECGACATAVDLKLKFIAHSGDISMANYGTGTSKPYGDAVIAAHRLLKNEVPVDQYILFTDQFLGDSGLELDGPGSLKDDSLGDITYKYLGIDHWKSEVLIDKKELARTSVDFEVTSTQEFEADADSIYRFISEFKYRHLWNQEASEIKFDENTINQVGEQHYCVVNGKDLLFDTIKPDYQEGLSYGEILKNPSPLKYMELNFLITEAAIHKTSVRIIMRVSLKWKFQKLLLPMIKKKMQSQAAKTLNNIAQGLSQVPAGELAA